MKPSTLRTLVLLTALLIGVGFALVFFYASNEADQGFIQKIFYLHVPLAITALCGFIVGGVYAVQHLRTGDRSYDARSYVAIHLSIIFGVGVLIRRSLIVILLCLELMLNAGNLALVAFSRMLGDQDGQVFALIVMVVAACEVVIGLGLIVALYRRRLPLDVDDLRELRG